MCATGHAGKTAVALFTAAACMFSMAIPMALSASATESGNGISADTSAQSDAGNASSGYQAIDARTARDSSKLELDDKTVTSISIKYQTATKGDDGSLTYGEWQEMTPGADGSYNFDSYNNTDWRYRIKVEYHIPQGELGDRDYLIYEIPKQLRVLENLSGPATNDSDDVVGTYTLSTDGYMIIKLNDSVVKGNADHPLDGSLRFDVQVSEQGKKDGETIDLPGKKDIITIGKSYDLHVAKTSGTRDKIHNTVPYTVTVSTEYGTATNISLDDYLTNGTVEGDIVVKDKNGNAVTPLPAADCADVQGDAANRTFSTCLPKLNAGEQYTVTYTTKASDVNANGNKISNTAKVTSKDGNGNKLTDESTSDVYLNNKPGVEKTAGDRDANGNIKWTVTVNRNGDNLKGWTLRDLPGDGVDVPGNIQMRNTATGKTSNISLPYTFSGDDTGTYEITYVTATTKLQSDYSNTATLCPTTNEVKNDFDSAGVLLRADLEIRRLAVLQGTVRRPVVQGQQQRPEQPDHRNALADAHQQGQLVRRQHSGRLGDLRYAAATRRQPAVLHRGTAQGVRGLRAERGLRRHGNPDHNLLPEEVGRFPAAVHRYDRPAAEGRGRFQDHLQPGDCQRQAHRARLLFDRRLGRRHRMEAIQELVDDGLVQLGTDHHLQPAVKAERTGQAGPTAGDHILVREVRPRLQQLGAFVADQPRLQQIAGERHRYAVGRHDIRQQIQVPRMGLGRETGYGQAQQHRGRFDFDVQGAYPRRIAPSARRRTQQLQRLQSARCDRNS